jgi:hypothetical protein
MPGGSSLAPSCGAKPVLALAAMRRSRGHAPEALAQKGRLFFLSAQPQEAPFQFCQTEYDMSWSAMRTGVGQALVSDRLDKRRQ